MIGSAVAAALTYVSKIQVPAPHGGFIVLPLVNKPFLWVLWIVVGSLVSGILLALIASRSKDSKPVVASPSLFEEGPVDSKVSENKVEEDHNPDDILTENNIKVLVNVNSRDDALRYLAQLAVTNHLATNADEVYHQYQTRELEGSTGMTDGFAIPHAQSNSIKKSAMLVLKLSKPVEWNSLDGKKIDTVISFLIPENDSNDHLQYLSNTAKLLTHADFVAKLKQANSPQAVKLLFKATK